MFISMLERKSGTINRKKMFSEWVGSGLGLFRFAFYNFQLYFCVIFFTRFLCHNKQNKTFPFQWKIVIAAFIYADFFFSSVKRVFCCIFISLSRFVPCQPRSSVSGNNVIENKKKKQRNQFLQHKWIVFFLNGNGKQKIVFRL